MAPTHKKKRIHLLDLPTEILLQIIDHLNDGDKRPSSSVKQLRLTCKQACETCEPAFCRVLTSATSCALQRCQQIMAARESRRFLTQVLVLQLVWDFFEEPDVLAIRDHVTCVLGLPNIKFLDLEFDPDGLESDMLTAALSYQLNSNAFSQLRECKLCLNDANVFALTGVLNAPKLDKLQVEWADLRSIRSGLIRLKSSPLKRLSLSNCVLDAPSMAALFGLPAALQHLEIDTFSRNRGKTGTNLPQTIQLILSTLERCQPSISSLALSLEPSESLTFGGLGCTFDFSHLQLLKELDICGDADGEDFRWIPLLAFEQLPPSLEILKFGYECSACIDLGALAKALVDPQYTGGGPPKTLRRVECYSHAVWMGEGEYDIIDEGVECFMALLPVAEVSYTVDNGIRTRIVEARRMSEHAQCRMILRGNTYELRDYLVFTRHVKWLVGSSS
ncbi:hypothetical protein H2200_004599 [Cladophialophora chaetospira]|uniref:F-box domain-containing protein n=1 Tax=Cladophialophora chaetospira TaxID=386627 RepID=A0AA38XDJ5_9EURO|nr:hypothetical protein H2200_004599 [Cladophialophora chaetospira]